MADRSAVRNYCFKLKRLSYITLVFGQSPSCIPEHLRRRFAANTTQGRRRPSLSCPRLWFNRTPYLYPFNSCTEGCCAAQFIPESRECPCYRSYQEVMS